MHTKKLLAPDVFAENECVVFDRARASKMTSLVPDIAAMCIVTTELQLPREMELLDKANADYVAPLLFDNQLINDGYKIWLFASHGPWQPNSVMVNHNKLWKSFPSKWTLDNFLLSREVMLESSEGIRFAGVAEVSKNSFLTPIQILRSESSCAIIASKRDYVDSERGVVHLFNSAFPTNNGVPQTRIDWLSLALDCCSLEDVVVRVSGSWDEREASLDLIMLSRLLPRLANLSTRTKVLQ